MLPVTEKGPMIGCIYYRYINDTLIKIRLLRIKNDNCYVVESIGQRFNMTKTEFDTYEKLRPDGYVAFTIALMDEGVKDVMTLFYRKEEINSKERQPFAVCRMNIFDVFTNTINKDKDIMYIGCSVNIDSCPMDLDYRIMASCNGVDRMDMVAVYIEDDLDSILKLVNTVAFDEVLYTLHKGYIPSKTAGACSTLRQLLEQNQFIDDIYYGFKEVKVGFEYFPQVAEQLVVAVEDIIKHKMNNAVWTTFDRDIDLSKIEDKYLIVRDVKNKLFIVSYEEGEYVNRPYFSNPDTAEYDTLTKIIQS